MRGAFLFLWRQFHNISFSVKDEKRLCGVIWLGGKRGHTDMRTYGHADIRTCGHFEIF